MKVKELKNIKIKRVSRNNSYYKLKIMNNVFTAGVSYNKSESKSSVHNETVEKSSFSVDSKDKETGAKRREKIYFSINDIADPNLAFSKLFGHEKAHMNTYDEGKDGEETAIHTTKKIGSENKNKVFTEKEKADYLNSLRNKYKDQKSIEEQFAEAKLVPEKDKEHWTYSKSGSTGGALFEAGGVGYTEYTSIDYKKNRVEVVRVIEGEVGQGAPFDIGVSLSLGWYPGINSFDEFGSNTFSRGGSINPQLISNNIPNPLGLTVGGDIITNSSDSKIIGMKFSLGKSFKNYDLHMKNGVFTKILSIEYYTIYGYYEKFYPRGGRNSWKSK